MNFFKFAIITSVVAMGLNGCGSGATKGADTKRKVVTVSLPPQAWFVEEIAGDSVEVNVLLGAGANPETFEPSLSVVKAAGESDVMFISGGLAFERVLAKRIAARVVDTSEGIDKLYGTHDHCSAAHDGHHHHGEADPHTWTSVKNGKTIARNIYEALVDADPSRADYYSERYAALTERLDELDATIAERITRGGRKAFMVMHPSLGYFARDYGLEQLSLGGSEGRESSVKGVRRQLDKALESGIDLVFVQADYDSRQAENVASQLDAKVVTINLLDRQWDAELIKIADALAQ